MCPPRTTVTPASTNHFNSVSGQFRLRSIPSQGCIVFRGTALGHVRARTDTQAAYASKPLAGRPAPRGREVGGVEREEALGGGGGGRDGGDEVVSVLYGRDGVEAEGRAQVRADAPPARHGLSDLRKSQTAYCQATFGHLIRLERRGEEGERTLRGRRWKARGRRGRRRK